MRLTGPVRVEFNGVDLSADVVYVSLHTAYPTAADSAAATEVSASGYARQGSGDGAWTTFTISRPVMPAEMWHPCDVSPDAHRYDASRAEAEAEMAEWDAILSGLPQSLPLDRS